MASTAHDLATVSVGPWGAPRSASSVQAGPNSAGLPGMGVRGVLGLCMVGLITLVAALAPVLAPYDVGKQDYTAIMKPPSTAHLLGTDNLRARRLHACDLWSAGVACAWV